MASRSGRRYSAVPSRLNHHHRAARPGRAAAGRFGLSHVRVGPARFCRGRLPQLADLVQVFAARRRRLMNQLWQILAVVRDILLAPIRALLDPWKAMHGKIGGGLFQLSTAAVAALLVCLLFTIIAIAFGLTLLNSPQYDFARWLAGGLGVFALIMVLTVVVYYMVRAYTQEAGD